jgi:hypothetical protein
MKGILLEDYNSKINDYVYKEGQKVTVFELNNFKNYATYFEDSIDWIPKDLVRII